jgi:hypothetical protein
MWSRPTERGLAESSTTVLRTQIALWGGLAAALFVVVACGGRDACLYDPLPERGPVVDPALLPVNVPRVRLTTTAGDIVVALYQDKAPTRRLHSINNRSDARRSNQAADI